MNFSKPLRSFARTVAIVGVTLSLALSGCSRTTEPELVEPDIYTSPYDTREYRAIELENGLRVVLVSDPETEKSAAALAVQVGSMQNPDEQLGLAHFLEHMLFLGTEKYPDPDEYGEFMSRHGGMHNAYTADDHTNYMFEVNNNALPEALDRFSDFFKAPLFIPEYVEKEVNAVHSEWSMQRANDGFILFALNNITLNPEHPIARFRIGNNETLSDKEDSLLLPTMIEFYERYYSANLMTASVIGALSLDELEQLARDAFSDIPNFDAEVPEITAWPVTDEHTQKLIYYRPQIEQRTVLMDFTIPNVQHAFRHNPERLVSYLISSEMPGTPAALLREAGLIDSLNAFGDSAAYGNAGRMRVAISLTEQGFAQKEMVMGLMFRYFEMLRNTGIDEAYVDELRTVLNNEFQFLRRQGAFQYASGLAANLLAYPTRHVIDHPYRMDSYDEDSTRQILDALSPSNARIFVIAPNVETTEEMYYFDGSYRVEHFSDETLGEWLTMAAQAPIGLPAVNRLLPEDLSLVEGPVTPEPTLLLDEPGLSLWHQRSSRFQEPRAVVEVQFYQPTHELSWEERTAARLLIDSFSLSEAGFAREAGIAGVGFSLSSGRGMTLRLQGFNDKHQQLAGMVMDRFIAFAPSEEQLDQSRDRVRREIENTRRQRPLQRLFPAYQTMTQREYLTEQERLTRLRAIDLADLQAARERLLAGAEIRALVFGNHSPADAIALTRALANYVPVDPSIQYQQYAPARTLENDFPLAWQEDIRLEDSAALEVRLLNDSSMEAGMAVRMLRELMHNRFFNQLRTEEQLGYAVGVTQVVLQDLPGLGFYIQSPVRGPAPLIERFELFVADFREYLGTMSDERFAETQQSIRTELQQPPQNLNQEAGQLRSEWVRDEAMFDRRERLIAIVDAMTKDDLVQVFNTMFDGDSADRARARVEFRGSRFSEIPFSDVSGWTEFSGE
ncbi:MAG: insulinase family protein [Idiomarina sp.]|nr:insulinase family protein [Idiomarina sp.]